MISVLDQVRLTRSLADFLMRTFCFSRSLPVGSAVCRKVAVALPLTVSVQANRLFFSFADQGLESRSGSTGPGYILRRRNRSTNGYNSSRFQYTEREEKHKNRVTCEPADSKPGIGTGPDHHVLTQTGPQTERTSRATKNLPAKLFRLLFFFVMFIGWSRIAKSCSAPPRGAEV